MDRTGPKMGFRSPKDGKKCQKLIEQVQKWVLGARRVEKSAKNNINKAFNAWYEIIYVHSYDK